MYHVCREINFCYGHRLLDYEGKCRHLHGHNGRLLITVEASELDCLGMVVDFSRIKKVIGRWIEDCLDHRMILRSDDPAVPVLKELGEPVCLLEVNPTAENIAKMIFEYAIGQGFSVVEVCLFETPQCFASYSRGGGGASLPAFL